MWTSQTCWGVVVAKLKHFSDVLESSEILLHTYVALHACRLGTRTFILLLRESDGGEFASMIISQILGVFLLQDMLFTVASFLRAVLLCVVPSVTPCAFRGLQGHRCHTCCNHEASS